MAVASSPPAIGPVVLVAFGLNLPVAALAFSLIGLLIARYLAPKSARRLSKWQERALTVLLALLLIVIVAGEAPMIGDGTPLKVGTALAWGIGLGTSGLLAVEYLGGRVRRGLAAMFTLGDERPRRGERDEL